MASIRAATCTAVCSPTILCVSFEVPFGAVAVATLQTFVFLLSVHLHEMKALDTLPGFFWSCHDSV